MSEAIAYSTIRELGARYRKRELSPVEVTRALLDRIAKLDTTLHTFVTVTPDRALADARAAEELLRRGDDRPLLGIPIGHKDIYCTRGIRTTGGSALLADWVPEVESTCARRWQDAGTVLLGKLITHEFAMGLQFPGHRFPPARNPWNVNHIPGGSSSGSGAALAAGLCYGALGSDTGGSIRTPVSHCGVVGIKPTYGRVSRYGVIPLSWSLDHAGPMARSVEDCALLLQAIAGHDPRDPACTDVAVPDFRATLKDGIQGLRIGVPRTGWFDENLGISLETEAAFNEALKILESLGAAIVELDGTPFSVTRKANQTILVCEAYAYHEKTYQETPLKFGASVRRRMLEGAFLSAVDYITAQRARSVLNERICANFARVDFFAVPGAPRPPEAFASMDPNEQNLRPSFTNPFNLTGLPALCFPCGFTEGNLPSGLQIVAPPFEEVTCFRVGYAYEQATDWHQRRPAL